MKCPHIRSDLPPLTERLKELPVDDRGYPVPFFVAWIDGKPDFRVADKSKYFACVKHNLCWVCGNPLGRFKAFTIGPMCAVNRTTAEPPEHLECAEWSVKGCPFLSRPNMVRREDEFTDSMDKPAGVMIKRNPGVMLIWVTTSYKLFKDGDGRTLINIGPSESVSWWKEGRPATPPEILEAIDSGVPLLEQHCYDVDDLNQLHKQVRDAKKLIPA